MQKRLFMKLLNPLFDSVFKYLLEDMDVAKALIEAIIRKEIIEITPAPQESSDFKLKMKYFTLGMTRQDFVAIIKSDDDFGKEIFEKVMIEVQKSPVAPEIGRFRHYIADKYRKKSSIEGDEKYIPIKTIYLIEEVFNPHLPAVLGRRGVYFDELENQQYSGARDTMVELFNHDSWFIQTELLPPEFKDELYYVLSVFAPNFRTGTQDRFIEIENADLLIKKHRILERILRRLQAATQDSEVNTGVELEIDYEKYIEKMILLTEQAEAKVEQAEAKVEQEKLAKEQAEAKAEQEKLAKEQAEAKAEQEKLAKEQAEAKAEQEKLAKEQAEAKAEQEKLAKEQAEAKAEQAEINANNARLQGEILKLYYKENLSVEQISEQMEISVEKVRTVLGI